MIDRHLARGLFLVAFALTFGLSSLRYSLGTLQRAGAGLFPLLVCALLLLVGLSMLVRWYFDRRHEALEFNARNIAIVLGSLTGCALLGTYVNMVVGIVFLVFCSTLAGTDYSLVRNVKISLGLIAVAFALHRFLGVQLPLL